MTFLVFRIKFASVQMHDDPEMLTSGQVTHDIASKQKFGLRPSYSDIKAGHAVTDAGLRMPCPLFLLPDYTQAVTGMAQKPYNECNVA